MDINYIDRLHDFFKENRDKKFSVSALTKDPNKLIAHISYYIDSRKYIDDYVDVSFNDNYTKIRIF